MPAPRAAALLLAPLALFGCAPETPTSTAGGCAGGKCDAAGEQGFRADLDAMNAEDRWSDGPPMESIADAYRVRVRIPAPSGGTEILAPTHILVDVDGDGELGDDDIRILPYSDELSATFADGTPAPDADAPLARAFEPGEIGWAIKHHRTEYRLLDAGALGGGGLSLVKEHAKIQDTHIQLVIGIERGGLPGVDGDGRPGVITLNNPQGYEDGRFDGSGTYPMIFVRPRYPDYVRDAGLEGEFEDNIRTMMVAFNAVTDFPGEYNGGDPLGAFDRAAVEQLVRTMVLAIAGDEEARAWFRQEENLVYCAELAHVSASAGLLVPLNDVTMTELMGDDVDAWEEFKALLDAHNEGESTPFVELNENQRVRQVRLTLAPEHLQPAPAYADSDAEMDRLAFRPMTAADIIASFLQTHFPRRDLGEQIAPVQGAVLEAMRDGIYEQMGMDQIPLVSAAEADAAPSDQRPLLHARREVEELYDRIVEVVGTPHESYEAFRAELEPFMERARELTGPRQRPDGSYTVGRFVPPSLLHLVAKGLWGGGLLELAYVAHGLHYDFVLPPPGFAPSDGPPPGDDQEVVLERAAQITTSGHAHRVDAEDLVGVTAARVELQTTRYDADLVVLDGFGDELCTSMQSGLQPDECLVDEVDGGLTLEVYGPPGTEYVLRVVAANDDV